MPTAFPSPINGSDPKPFDIIDGNDGGPGGSRSTEPAAVTIAINFMILWKGNESVLLSYSPSTFKCYRSVTRVMINMRTPAFKQRNNEFPNEQKSE